MAPMDAWILNKIMAYLTTKEGCDVSIIEDTDLGTRMEVVDAFGFRYEINIRTVSRNSNDFGDFNVRFSQSVALGISKV